MNIEHRTSNVQHRTSNEKIRQKTEFRRARARDRGQRTEVGGRLATDTHGLTQTFLNWPQTGRDRGRKGGKGQKSVSSRQ